MKKLLIILLVITGCETSFHKEMASLKIGMTKEEVIFHCGIPYYEDRYGIKYSSIFEECTLFFRNDTLVSILKK